MSDMDTIVHSFDYFATKYDHWHVIINQQSQDNIHHRSKIVNLHASTYSKKPRCQQDFHLSIVLGTFDMHSAATADAQQHNNAKSGSTHNIYIIVFISGIIFDNPSLILPFSRLQSFAISTKHVYFPMKNAFKFVQQFPSLVHIKMRVFLLDTCVPIIDILLVNDPCSINYVVEKRRQTCPLDICKKDEISVKVDTQFLEIYLSGCSICAKKKYYI
ncbi:unnamed protein product [Rotaria sp. Silwood2]|nr:unnamed protein product [Rotaria sp. Silwood2]